MHAWARRSLDLMKKDLFVDNCIACGRCFPAFFHHFFIAISQLSFSEDVPALLMAYSTSQQKNKQLWWWCCEFKIINAIQFSNAKSRRIFFFVKIRQFKIIAVCFVWLVKSLFFSLPAKMPALHQIKTQNFIAWKMMVHKLSRTHITVDVYVLIQSGKFAIKF